MLSTPQNGWTKFSLGSREYNLSYLTDIADDWLDTAASCLKHLTPFAVSAECEPGRLICTVSWWNTYIIFEADQFCRCDSEDIHTEICEVNMVQFCTMEYQ